MSGTTRNTDILIRFDAETGKLVTGMARAERTVSQKVGDMGRSMTKVGKNLTRYVAAPILGVIGASAKMAMEFDTTLLRMVTLAGKTSEEVAAMRPEIIKTATQYGKSAQEAAEAMYFIASSGVDGSKGMEILNKSLLMSAAGMGETEVLADLLTSAINAYGSKTLSAAEATDYLIGAIREGKADPTELAGAMARVLPIASNMGVQFREVAAAFAALSTGGTDANEAATQLRGILSSVLKPGKKAEKQLKDMGMSSEGLRKVLKEKGLLSLLGLLREKFKGNSSAVANVFGNVRALTGLLDLTGVKWKKSVEIFQGVAGGAGAAEGVQALLEGSPGFKYQQSIMGLKNSMIGFGDAAAPAIETVTDSLTKLTKALDSLSPSQKSFAVKVGFMIAALSGLVYVVGKLLKLFEKLAALATKFPKIAGFLGRLLPGVGGTIALTTGLEAADKALGAGKPAAVKAREEWRLKQLGIGAGAQAGNLATARYKAMQTAITGKAIGGSMSAGSTYLVGERGPELVTPSSSSWVTANNRLGGSAQPINVTVNVHGSVIRERDLASSVRDQIAQLMRRRGLDPSILGV